jgi:hypothetical protein
VGLFAYGERLPNPIEDVSAKEAIGSSVLSSHCSHCLVARSPPTHIAHTAARVQPVAGVHVRPALLPPLALTLPPVPRRDRLCIGPQAPLGLPSCCFRRGHQHTKEARGKNCPLPTKARNRRGHRQRVRPAERTIRATSLRVTASRCLPGIETHAGGSCVRRAFPPCDNDPNWSIARGSYEVGSLGELTSFLPRSAFFTRPPFRCLSFSVNVWFCSAGVDPRTWAPAYSGSVRLGVLG